MKEDISVLIADDNVEFGDLLGEYMNQQNGIDVAGVARDGLQTIDMIKTLAPDVVVLDIIMPNLDGIGVLEKMATAQMEQKPLFIMLSAIGQDIFTQKAIMLGAEYYVVKPFDVDVLISRIKQLYNEKYSSALMYNGVLPKTPIMSSRQIRPVYDLEVEITNLMHEIGIPPHIVGYQYIREAVMQMVQNPKAFSSITKVLYPVVAQKFNTTPGKVERAIRNAIESAWARGNPEFVDRLFGYATAYGKGKPTNSEFIAMMVDKIKVDIAARQ